MNQHPYCLLNDPPPLESHTYWPMALGSHGGQPEGLLAFPNRLCFRSLLTFQTLPTSLWGDYVGFLLFWGFCGGCFCLREVSVVPYVYLFLQLPNVPYPIYLAVLPDWANSSLADISHNHSPYFQLILARNQKKTNYVSFVCVFPSPLGMSLGLFLF